MGMKLPGSLLPKRLGAQLVALMADIILLGMGTNAYVQYRGELAMVERVIETRARSLGEMLAEVGTESILLFDVVSLNEYIARVIRQDNVVHAAYLDAQGKSLTVSLNTDNPYIKDALAWVGTRDVGLVAQQLRNLPALKLHRTPIVFNDKTLGFVELYLDRGAYTAQSSKSLRIAALVTVLIGLGVGVGLYIVIRRRILNPLRKLGAGAQQISRGKFDHHVAIAGHNELAELAWTFNLMAGRLKDLIAARDEALAQLEDANQTLEERVHQRTEELQTLNAEIVHQALHDPLTTLPNRTLLLERLQQAILLANRHNHRLAFFMIDLNNFKEVNDTLGHPAGDLLLQEVARRLPDVLRESDTVGRLGGDEFGIVLPEIELDQATVVAGKLLKALAPEIKLGDQALSISASVGIALYPDHGEDHTALIRHADVAMYESKHHTGKPCVYDPAADHYTTQRLALMADLVQAIDKNQLELHYQPQVDLNCRKVISVEALLRWNHPRLGWVAPELFIPMAESNNLIQRITEWVLSVAIRQLRLWQEQGLDLRVSVNLSARDLLNTDLASHIGTLCQSNGVEAQRLKIEITENTIMLRPEKLLEVTGNPVMAQIGYAIDDFGTGYSSLSHLKKLPVDEVKIDKSFVVDMDRDPEDANIVRSVIDLAHNLGHAVVAEGVENARTLTMLIELGCDVAQGFLFSKPVPAEELSEAIERIERQASSDGVICRFPE